MFRFSALNAKKRKKNASFHQMLARPETQLAVSWWCWLRCLVVYILLQRFPWEGCLQAGFHQPARNQKTCICYKCGRRINTSCRLVRWFIYWCGSTVNDKGSGGETAIMFRGARKISQLQTLWYFFLRPKMNTTSHAQPSLCEEPWLELWRCCVAAYAHFQIQSWEHGYTN